MKRKRGKYKSHLDNPLIGKKRGQFPVAQPIYLQIDLETLDGRTKLARLAKTLKRDLQKYVGQSNPVSDILIQSIVYKQIRLSVYYANNIDNPEDNEPGFFFQMSNSLRSDLDRLMAMAKKKEAPDLDKYLELIGRVGE